MLFTVYNVFWGGFSLFCQDENRTLDRMYKQKVEEVKGLSDRLVEVEEALTVAGGAASTIKEYKKQVEDLQVCTSASVFLPFFPLDFIVFPSLLPL